MDQPANAEVPKTTQPAPLIAAVEQLLASGDELDGRGFIEVTAASYHRLQHVFWHATGRRLGPDVSDALAIRHEEEQ